MNIKTQNKINKLIDTYNTKQNKFKMIFNIDNNEYLKYEIRLKGPMDYIYYVGGASSQVKIINKIQKLINEI